MKNPKKSIYFLGFYILFLFMVDIIEKFESKKEIINWEKVYRAREIMNIFWYNKWERFEWAIRRTIESIDNKKTIKDNFKELDVLYTWWRPKKDFLISRWWCYLLLKRCDQRKQEVILLQNYLKNLYLDIKINKIETENYNIKKHFFRKKDFSFEWIFWIFVIFLFVITFFFYNSTKNEFLIDEKTKIQINQIEQNYKKLSQEVIKNNEIIQKNEKETQKIEEKLNDKSLVTPQIISIEIDFEQKLENYLKEPLKFNYYYKDSNPRNDFTKTLTGIELIKTYFYLWNNLLYKDSCSLLSRNKCNALSKGIYVFENVFKNTFDWYQIIDLKKSEKDQNIYCVKYKYKLKNDTSNEYITETFNYVLQNKNWNEEITSRFCEKITKWNRVIKCPFTLKNYYCN